MSSHSIDRRGLIRRLAATHSAFSRSRKAVSSALLAIGPSGATGACPSRSMLRRRIALSVRCATTSPTRHCGARVCRRQSSGASVRSIINSSWCSGANSARVSIGAGGFDVGHEQVGSRFGRVGSGWVRLMRFRRAFVPSCLRDCELSRPISTTASTNSRRSGSLVLKLTMHERRRKRPSTIALLT